MTPLAASNAARISPQARHLHAHIFAPLAASTRWRERAATSPLRAASPAAALAHVSSNGLAS